MCIFVKVLFCLFVSLCDYVCAYVRVCALVCVFEHSLRGSAFKRVFCVYGFVCVSACVRAPKPL